jgi:hypothetical protein
VRLHFFEGLSVAEIASSLGRPPVTVRSQLARGVERLRARLVRTGEERDRRHAFGWAVLVRRLRAAWRRPQAWLVGAGVALALFGLVWLVRAAAPAGRPPLEVAAPGTPPATRAVAGQSARVPLEAPAPEPARPNAAPSSTARAVEGFVRAPDGAPVADATVWLGARSGAGVAVATSDEYGRYHVADVDSRRFLWATHSGFTAARRTYVASLASGNEHDLCLTASGGPLAVTVAWPDGRRAAGLQVALDDELGEGTVITSTGVLEIPARFAEVGTTDAQGSTEIAKPVRGRAALAIRDELGLLFRTHVELTAGPQLLDLVLARPPELRGTVLAPDGRPASGAEVLVRQDNEVVYLPLIADERGRFETTRLVPGAWLAAARIADGLASGTAHGTLAAGEVATIRIGTDLHGTLHGRVLAGEHALAGARVALHRSEGRGLPEEDAVRTDAHGRFAFVCNQTVAYRLELQLAGEAFPCAAVEPVRAGDEVVLRASDELRALRPLALQFVADRPEHRPTLIELRRGPPRIEHEVAVDPRSGRVEVALPPGDYELVAWVPGIGVWRSSRRFEPGGTVQRVVVPSPGVVELDLELPPASNAQAEVWLRLGGVNPFGHETLGSHSSTRELALDAAGRWSATMFPGRYAYCVRAAGFTDLAGTVRVRPGSLNRVRLAPALGALLELRIDYPRPLRRGEGIALYASGEHGASRLSAARMFRSAGQAEVSVSVPLDTTRIVARTNHGLVGAVAVDLAESERGDLSSQWQIALGDEELGDPQAPAPR